MTITPEARGRLAKAMDDRRLELGLRWQEVAERGGISLKSLYSARTGPSGIAALTQRGIEVGLRWPAGSVQTLLGGGELEPGAPSGAAPGPTRADRTPLPPPPVGEPFDPQGMAVLAPKATAILRRLDQVRQAGVQSPDGWQMFPEDHELALGWQAMRSAGFTPEAGLWYLAAAWAEREQERRDEDRHRSGTSGA